MIALFIASFALSLVFALTDSLLGAVFLALLAAVALGQLMMEDVRS